MRSFLFGIAALIGIALQRYRYRYQRVLNSSTHTEGVGVALNVADMQSLAGHVKRVQVGLCMTGQVVPAMQVQAVRATRGWRRRQGMLKGLSLLKIRQAPLKSALALISICSG